MEAPAEEAAAMQVEEMLVFTSFPVFIHARNQALGAQTEKEIFADDDDQHARSARKLGAAAAVRVQFVPDPQGNSDILRLTRPGGLATAGRPQQQHHHADQPSPHGQPEDFELNNLTECVRCEGEERTLLVNVSTEEEALRMQFKSFLEREAFCACLQALAPNTVLANDAQTWSRDGSEVLFRLDAYSMVGRNASMMVALFPHTASISFNDREPISLHDVTFVASPGSRVRVDAITNFGYHHNRTPTQSPRLAGGDDDDDNTRGDGEEGTGENVHELDPPLSPTSSSPSSSGRKMCLLFKSAAQRSRFLALVHSIIMRGQETADQQPLLVHTMTCNVAAKKTPPKDLSACLPAGDHDLYVVGLQECTKRRNWVHGVMRHLNTAQSRQTLLRRIAASHRSTGEQEQEQEREREQGLQQPYTLVAATTLCEIHIVVAIRSDLHHRVSYVSTSTRATGIGNVWGNKGGAAVGVVFRDGTSVAFVTSHLAAKSSRVAQRQDNYEDICAGLRLGSSSQVAGIHNRRRLDFLHQFQHVFWLGDLNYRIDMGQPGTAEEFAAVQEHIRMERTALLYEYDQLHVQRDQQAVFHGFSEMPITFAPTYRMQKGSEGYSNKNNQNASFCDRVLWRSHPGVAPLVEPISYTAAHGMVQSDHRPVMATFRLHPTGEHSVPDPHAASSASAAAVLTVSGLRFQIAPDMAHPKARYPHYDAFVGPLCVSLEANFLREALTTGAVRCDNPEAASNIVPHQSRAGQPQKTLDAASLGALRAVAAAAGGTAMPTPRNQLLGEFDDSVDPDMEDSDIFRASGVSTAMLEDLGLTTDAFAAAGALDADSGSDDEDNEDVDEDDSKSTSSLAAAAAGSPDTPSDDYDDTRDSDDGMAEEDDDRSGQLLDLHAQLRMSRPEWIWSGQHTRVGASHVTDPDWLASQTLRATVSKHSASGAVVGVAELPMPREPQPRDSQDGAHGDCRSVAFDVPVLARGKWVGTLTGTVEVTYIAGDADPAEVDPAAALQRAGQWLHIVDKTRDAYEAQSTVSKKTGPVAVQSTQRVVVAPVRQADANAPDVGHVELGTPCRHCGHGTVAADQDSAAICVGEHVWHPACLICTVCNRTLHDQDELLFPYDRGDGLGTQLFCETCFVDMCMPPCGGCAEPVRPWEEDVLQACSQMWHRDHFRCTASGEVLTEHFLEHEGLPYSESAYYELFGQRCVACAEFVQADDESAVELLDNIWHDACFCCTSSGAHIEQDADGGYQCVVKDRLPYSVSEYARLFGRDCVVCERKVLPPTPTSQREHDMSAAAGTAAAAPDMATVEFMGFAIHPQCFTCQSCSTDLCTQSADQVFRGDDSMPYCSACAHDRFPSSRKLVSVHKYLSTLSDPPLHSVGAFGSPLSDTGSCGESIWQASIVQQKQPAQSLRHTFAQTPPALVLPSCTAADARHITLALTSADFTASGTPSTTAQAVSSSLRVVTSYSPRVSAEGKSSTNRTPTSTLTEHATGSGSRATPRRRKSINRGMVTPLAQGKSTAVTVEAGAPMSAGSAGRRAAKRRHSTGWLGLALPDEADVHVHSMPLDAEHPPGKPSSPQPVTPNTEIGEGDNDIVRETGRTPSAASRIRSPRSKGDEHGFYDSPRNHSPHRRWHSTRSATGRESSTTASKTTRPRQRLAKTGHTFTATSATGHVQKSGFLEKRGESRSMIGRKVWRPRFVVVADAVLQYYKTADDFHMNRQPVKKLALDLTLFTVSLRKYRNELVLTSRAAGRQGHGDKTKHGTKTLVLRTSEAAELRSWHRALQACTQLVHSSGSFGAEASLSHTDGGHVPGPSTSTAASVAGPLPAQQPPQQQSGSGLGRAWARATSTHPAPKRRGSTGQIVAAPAPVFDMQHETGAEPQSPRLRFATTREAFTATTAADFVQMHGYLEKRGGGTSMFGTTGWKRRYFVLADGMLQYYRDESDFHGNAAPLKNASLDVSQHIVTSITGTLELVLEPRAPSAPTTVRSTPPATDSSVSPSSPTDSPRTPIPASAHGTRTLVMRAGSDVDLALWRRALLQCR